MSEEFSFDIDENSMNEFKKAINYDEIEARHQRFANGTETEDDLINGMYHYKIQIDKGLDLDVVEFKYYNKLIDLYQTEKIGNHNLQMLLDEEKEKNKELFEEYNKRVGTIVKYEQGIKEFIDETNISDIEPWSEYKIKGNLLFNLQNLLEE